MNTEHITLDNGLNTLLIDSPNSNVTTAQIWFKAGSSLENKENHGIAHFLEHMFFKGSKKYPDMQVAKTVEGFGGEINAFTSFDYTCYYINGPADKTLTTVDALMDMVSNPMFLEEELIPERDVVFEEYRRSIDNPSQFNFFNIQKNCFPKQYRHPILGNEKTIKTFTTDQVKNFRKKYYNLENSMLIIAGKLKDKDKILKTINEYSLPHGDVSKFTPFKLKNKTAINIHEKDVNQCTMTLAIQAPDYNDNLSPIEDLAVNCMAFGDISPLYKNLVTNTSLASGTSGTTMFFANGGCHFVRFAFPIENLDKLLKEVPKTLKSIFNEGFSADAVDRIRNQYIASKIYERESIESYAFALGHGFAQSGEIHCEEDFINKMKNASRSQVHQALLNVFNKDIHYTLQVPKGHKTKELNAKIEKLNSEITKVTKSIKTKKGQFKEVVSKFDSEAKLIQLAPGIKLIYRHNPMTPTFTFHSYLKGGLSYEQEENNGIYNLLAKNITYGHKKITYDELKNDLDKKSSYLNGFSGRNAYGMTLHGLSDFFPSLIEHFMKTLAAPSLPSDYFKLEKELIKRTIHIQKQDPVKSCFKKFNKLVFNKHPYSRELIGNEKNLKSLTRKKLNELHQKNLKEQQIVFTYCGDLDQETLIDYLMMYIDLFPTRTFKKATQKNKIAPLKNQEIHIPFDREQTHIMIGKSAFKVNSLDDLYLKVFTTYLSGQSSELFIEVRDKQGLCYAVQPLHNTSVEAGYWGIYIGAGHDKKDLAIKAIMEIINKYQKKGLSQKEFNKVKEMIHGQNQIAIQTNDDYANFYSIPVLHDLGFDYQHEAFQKIKNMKRADFNKFLANYLKGGWNTIQVGRD